MADELLGSARFEIHGDARGATQAANQANSSFAQLEQIVATNWWGLQNLAMAFAALPAAVAAGVGVAINYAKQWEDAMFDVQRTSAATGPALDEIEAALFRVARTTPIATTELAALAAEGAALGIANENIAEFARVMGGMVAATDLTAEGVENVARVLNIMQVPEDEFENFSSALIDIGRNTAATESDIITASKRLATIGAVANATTPDVLGMGAAIRSLGPEAEAGSSAVNKTITDMANAIGTGSDELAHFASISGKSVEEFSNIFRGNGYDALRLYLTGLGQLPDAMVGVQQAFEATGADGVRQQQALATLANGTRDLGNEQRDLNAILDLAAEKYRQGTVAQTIMDQKAATLSGQMQILKNNVFEAGSAFGAMMLPALKTMVGWLSGFAGILSDVANGFKVMNPGIRMAVSVLAVLTFGFMAAAAAALTIGPRIIIALGAMKQLRGVQQQTTQGTTQLTSSTLTLAQAQRIAAGAAQQHRAGLAGVLGLIGGLAVAQQQEAAATQRSTAVGEQKIGMLTRMRGAYANLSVVTRRAIASTVAMTGAMIAMTYWMARSGDAIEQAQAQRAGMIKGLKDQLAEQTAVARETGASNEAIRNHGMNLVRQQQIYKDTAAEAGKFGVSVDTLNGIISGTASEADSLRAINDIQEAALNGNDGAKKLFNGLKDLYGAFGKTRDATKDNVSALGAYTESAEAAKGITQELADELNAQAQAHIDIIDATFAARAAQLDLKDAEDALADARAASANAGEEIADAEHSLRRARAEHQSAMDDLRKAERDLTRARQDGIDQLKDAEDDLADSRDSYLDGLDKIKDMEEALDALRKGPTLKELTKATNDLRNAQLRLLDANRKVEDAEWQLQYLREQGASNRDIADAEFTLAEARQEVNNQQQSLNEAEEELAELRDEAARQQAVIKAERDLAAARRDSAATLRDIKQGEQEVADLRQKVANDGFYKDALADVADAQDGVRDATRGVRDAEAELQAARSASNLRDVERAQLDYEQALYRVATANTEVERVQAAMNGEIWDAGDAAAALARNLGLVISSIPNEEARSRLSGFMDILRKAPNPGKVAEDGDIPVGSGIDVDSLVPESDAIGEALGNAIEEALKDQSWWQSLLPMLAGSLGAMLIQGLLMAGKGAALVGFLSTVLPFAIVALLIAGLAAVLIKDRNWAKITDAIWQGMQKAWDGITDIGVWIWQNVLHPAFVDFPVWAFTSGVDLIEGLWNGMVDGIGEFFSNVGQWLYDNIAGPIMRAFGIRSPSTVFSGMGLDMIKGLWNGMTEGVGRFLGNIGQKFMDWIVRPLGNAGSWLLNAGSNVVIGMSNGIASAAWRIFDFFYKLPGNIWNALGNVWEAGSTLFNMGKNIVHGLINGIWSMGKQLWDTVTDFISRNIPGPVKWALGISSPSKVMAELGKYAAEGLGVGLLADEDKISKAAHQLALAAQPDLKDMATRHNVDYLLSSQGGLGSFDSAVGSARVPNGAGATTINYGDTVTINAETNASPTDIVNEYLWNKRVRTRR